MGEKFFDAEDKKTHFRDGEGFYKKPSTPLGTGNVIQNQRYKKKGILKRILIKSVSLKKVV